MTTTHTIVLGTYILGVFVGYLYGRYVERERWMEAVADLVQHIENKYEEYRKHEQ